MTQNDERGPGWKGWEGRQGPEDWVESVRSGECEIWIAIELEALRTWVTRAPEGYIWSSTEIGTTRVPQDWEKLVREYWPPMLNKESTQERAIGCLRLEIEENYAPYFAEEEWKRRNGGRRRRWRHQRGRLVGILEKIQAQREGSSP